MDITDLVVSDIPADKNDMDEVTWIRMTWL